ncbi:unannotated protein [freshwater metagenome]|uniref:Unannotated protein n=1 Tax=freshwater metagenome TaxID=449393 RepID=A0A6J6R8H0_9ZZZZ
MARELTVGVRGLLATAVAVLALVVAYLLGSGGGGPAQAADPSGPSAAEVAAASKDARTLTMTGTGTAVAVPDQLAFTVAVSLTRDDLETALDEANTTMNGVLDALAGAGVERKDLQTAGLSMSPVYDYQSSGPPVLRGYQVSQRVAVLVRELRQGGAAVNAAVAAGGNAVRVNGIRLEISDPEAVLAQARQDAVDQATAKAEQYADATGQQLGDVLTLREVGGGGRAGGYPVAASAAYDVAAEVARLPIRAGQQDLEVNLQVVWEFVGADQ